MRKASEELNSEAVIANIGYICGQELKELPYWETINLYLEKVADKELQEIICKLVKHLVRGRLTVTTVKNASKTLGIQGKFSQVFLGEA